MIMARIGFFHQRTSRFCIAPRKKASSKTAGKKAMITIAMKNSGQL
jgi:hypothetical protein